jgi:NADPH-dependent 2,4-dienoyl-CoA reductase/sulfur reductase-like enzyme/rhodanese-related sulfurtransferase
VVEEPYDALVLAPGALPIRPPLPGIDHPAVFTVRTIPDTRRLRALIDERRPRRALVVGGGFIGLEMAENLVRRGLAVTILEKAAHVLPPLDPEMAAPVAERLRRHGVELRFGDGLAGFADAGGALVARTESGAGIPADLVVLAIGVRPDTALAAAAGLVLGPRGGIRVDERMRTSDPAIWAVGDAVEVTDVVTGSPALVALAGPANRQGRVAADAIAGRVSRFRGCQATAICSVFGLAVAMTGASARALARARKPFSCVHLHPGHHAGYFPGASPIHLKLCYGPDGAVLGAQAVGEEGVDKRIDVIAGAIQHRATVHDLAEAELCYAPQFGSAKDPVNLAGMIAANALAGDLPLAQWGDWPAAGAALIDVREPAEFAAGHVPGAINVPLSGLRGRLDGVPSDVEAWLYCGVGQRSYYAARLLAQRGRRVRSLSGGYRTWLDLGSPVAVPAP